MVVGRPQIWGKPGNKIIHQCNDALISDLQHFCLAWVCLKIRQTLNPTDFLLRWGFRGFLILDTPILVHFSSKVTRQCQYSYSHQEIHLQMITWVTVAGKGWSGFPTKIFSWISVVLYIPIIYVLYVFRYQSIHIENVFLTCDINM